jgi:hypothetical protein
MRLLGKGQRQTAAPRWGRPEEGTSIRRIRLFPRRRGAPLRPARLPDGILDVATAAGLPTGRALSGPRQGQSTLAGAGNVRGDPQAGRYVANPPPTPQPFSTGPTATLRQHLIHGVPASPHRDCPRGGARPAGPGGRQPGSADPGRARLGRASLGHARAALSWSPHRRFQPPARLLGGRLAAPVPGSPEADPGAPATAPMPMVLRGVCRSLSEGRSEAAAADARVPRIAEQHRAGRGKVRKGGTTRGRSREERRGGPDGTGRLEPAC